MRLVATVFLWILTTIALAVAVPAMWAQKNFVDERGYSAFAASAAHDPGLQEAMVNELTEPVSNKLAAAGSDVRPTSVHPFLEAYVKGPSFPGQFALINQNAHRWLFTDAMQQGQDSNSPVVVDLTPMLSDPDFKNLLATFNVELPDSLVVPLKLSEGLRPGQLRPLSTWGPWVSVGAAILTGVCALLMLAAARSRGKALAALGVSALLVGAAGWAGLEVARRHMNAVLNRVNGNVRDVAEALINHGVGGLHLWLNLTLAAGGVLVVAGAVLSMLGGLRRKD
ncbi:MAG TPA: hypothetical protein VHU62_14915 [Mycobacterium sp.]|nr:hypothetical protein [Mycobacterium sp.]